MLLTQLWDKAELVKSSKPGCKCMEDLSLSIQPLLRASDATADYLAAARVRRKEIVLVRLLRGRASDGSRGQPCHRRSGRASADRAKISIQANQGRETQPRSACFQTISGQLLCSQLPFPSHLCGRDWLVSVPRTRIKRAAAAVKSQSD